MRDRIQTVHSLQLLVKFYLKVGLSINSDVTNNFHYIKNIALVCSLGVRIGVNRFDSALRFGH